MWDIEFGTRLLIFVVITLTSDQKLKIKVHVVECMNRPRHLVLNKQTNDI